MPNVPSNALKAARHLSRAFKYVVISIQPSTRAIPAGMVFHTYAGHSLEGWSLRVTHKTSQADFERQVRSLCDNGILRPESYKFGTDMTGNQFFRCVLEPPDDDTPF